MRAFPYLPGVPAAGHMAGGFWHPGAISTCRKGDCGRDRDERERQRREQRERRKRSS